MRCSTDKIFYKPEQRILVLLSWNSAPFYRPLMNQNSYFPTEIAEESVFTSNNLREVKPSPSTTHTIWARTPKPLWGDKENSFGFKSCKGRLAITGSCTNADKVKLFTETRKLSPVPVPVTHPVLSCGQCCLYCSTVTVNWAGGLAGADS